MSILANEKKIFKNKRLADPAEISISYFTDPLCAWSWAFEKEWQLLKEHFGNQLHISYHMGGLIPDWKTFNDSVNAVTRPAQMGPVWMHIAELTKVELNYLIWVRNPPSSSYPAGIAFKCVELQSGTLAETYLFLLRRAAMVSGENISKTKVLLHLAENPVMQSENFDKVRFKKDLLNGAGLEAFRKDLQIVQTHRIGRFPTLVIRKNGKSPVMISGYKKFPELIEMIERQ